jgi:ferredoxin
MPVEEALDADEKARGAILACQARPVTDIVVAA